MPLKLRMSQKGTGAFWDISMSEKAAPNKRVRSCFVYNDKNYPKGIFT